MRSVELTTAYEWICDECGKANFCPSVKLEDPEMIAEVKAEHGFDGELCVAPTTVTCVCGVMFHTKDGG